MTRARLLPLLLALGLAACGTQPRQPDWMPQARAAQERFQRAYLSGDDRVAAAEFKALRTALAGTGRPELVARAELTHCAMQVASLDFGTCPGFEALRMDAGEAERAYADFLAGQPIDAGRLPAAYAGLAGAAAAEGLARMPDPVSRLIAAGVLLRSGRADPGVLQVAADTASWQGWRRPLLAWLGAQLRLAERAGAEQEVLRLRRRIALASQGR